VEYVSARLTEDTFIGADFEEFKRVFERFTPAEQLLSDEEVRVTRLCVCGSRVEVFPVGLHVYRYMWP
jgi:hypothetical protein